MNEKHYDENQMGETEKLVNVKEMADILGVPPSWIYSRTRIKGPDSIPHFKIGKYCRFRPSETIRWVERQNEAEG